MVGRTRNHPPGFDVASERESPQVKEASLPTVVPGRRQVSHPIAHGGWLSQERTRRSGSPVGPSI